MDWQTSRKTIRERTQYMFNNALHSDIEFAVVKSNGELDKIPAHKFILAIGSPVFESQFHGPMAEKDCRTINYNGTVEGLLEFLRYVYYDEVQLNQNVVMEVLHLAKFYIVPSLVSMCSHFLEENLGPKDVFIVLPEAIKYEEVKLQGICWKCVEFDTELAVTSEAFLNVTQEILCDILERDSLRIREIDLFKAVYRWAEHKMQRQGSDGEARTMRDIIGDKAFHLIRFPTMSKEEIGEVLSQASDLLTKKELFELFLYFAKEDNTILELFNSRRRIGDKNTSICKRFLKVCTNIRWEYIHGKKDTVSFNITGATINLTGIKFFGEQNAEYSVELELFEEERLIHDQKWPKKFQSKESQMNFYDFTLYLEKSVSLQPGKSYCISALITGPKSFRGIEGMCTVHCDNNVVFHFQNIKSENGTGHDTGQFPELLFYI